MQTAHASTSSTLHHHAIASCPAGALGTLVSEKHQRVRGNRPAAAAAAAGQHAGALQLDVQLMQPLQHHPNPFKSSGVAPVMLAGQSKNADTLRPGSMNPPSSSSAQLQDSLHQHSLRPAASGKARAGTEPGGSADAVTMQVCLQALRQQQPLSKWQQQGLQAG